MSRYIDAEILLDAMRHITLGETDVARSEMKIVHYICHMPHIDDVRENVRGEWIPHRLISREYIGTILVNVSYDYWFCDTCGYRVEDGQPMYNFCPNCGADMRGGKKRNGKV